MSTASECFSLITLTQISYLEVYVHRSGRSEVPHFGVIFGGTNWGDVNSSGFVTCAWRPEINTPLSSFICRLIGFWFVQFHLPIKTHISLSCCKCYLKNLSRPASTVSVALKWKGLVVLIIAVMSLIFKFLSLPQMIAYLSLFKHFTPVCYQLDKTR